MTAFIALAELSAAARDDLETREAGGELMRWTRPHRPIATCDCLKQFYTAAEAEQALETGCPDCGGFDIVPTL